MEELILLRAERERLSEEELDMWLNEEEDLEHMTDKEKVEFDIRMKKLEAAYEKATEAYDEALKQYIEENE